MQIAGLYSFNGGESAVCSGFKKEWKEIQNIILKVDSSCHRTKKSIEKTMRGKMLFAPKRLNVCFKDEFSKLGWVKHKIYCEYGKEHYVGGFSPPPAKSRTKPYREMDFVKHRLGVEVQLGKYAFMVYNVCAKMTIFRNLEIIEAGVEIVPMKMLADEMSTGVSYFEQIVWDLQNRGIADIDVPVMVVGIHP